MTNLKTVWSDEPYTTAYPRPQMVRDSYFPLDGKWDYAIRKGDLSVKPSADAMYDGKILVPFSPECMLSGVNRTLMPGEVLIYRTFFKRERDAVALLHFGAVDYECRVYVNGNFAAEHIGGYTPFSCEIQSFLKEGENELVVCVTDPGDSEPISRGKQSSTHGGIWYTPQSGIWQSVWLEYLPATYIEKLKITPDFDAKTVTISVFTNTGTEKFTVRTKDGKTYESDGEPVTADCRDCTPWTPETPALYDFEASSGGSTSWWPRISLRATDCP